MFSIVSRHHLIGELIPAVYMRHRMPKRTYGPHDLALLLITLGIGVLVDLSLPPYHAEAQHYYRLARSAIGLQSVLTNRSLVTVKCLHLMSIYNGMSGKESNLEHSYSLLNFAGQIALGVRSIFPYSALPKLIFFHSCRLASVSCCLMLCFDINIWQTWTRHFGASKAKKPMIGVLISGIYYSLFFGRCDF
jgi:hypothetical protein